jgi:LysR family transcriptional activator of nhaA
MVEKQFHKQYGLDRIGRIQNVRNRFYAISVERRLKHPAVVAICEAARATLSRLPSKA